MIKLIPTNHLVSEEEIIKILDKENPDVIGIELCDYREKIISDKIVFEQLGDKQENKSLLGKITDSIKSKAEEQGLDYGSDMKAALHYSIKNNVSKVMIDMPILKIQELFSKIPIEEQQGFTKELTEFENNSIKKKVNEEKVLTEMKKRYPIAFEFLINMRNLYMANKILIMERENKNKKIIIIIGSSHSKQINKLIGGKT